MAATVASPTHINQFTLTESYHEYIVNSCAKRAKDIIARYKRGESNFVLYMSDTTISILIDLCTQEGISVSALSDKVCKVF